MRTIFLFLLVLMIFYKLEVVGQQCTGALGEPVVNIDFNRGSSVFGQSVSNATTYRFVAGTPNDGEYTISKNTNGMYNDDYGWHQITNHTPNDPNGYMMIVNASIDPGIIYQTSLPALCPGTTYEFSGWIINLLNYSGKKPNISFQIETKLGKVLKEYATGEIPDGPTPEWIKYSTIFKVEDETELILKIVNLGMGGSGNDVAFDDIAFRPCGPIATQHLNLKDDLNATLCENDIGNYRFEANVSDNFYANPGYQWQVNTGTGWNDISGETETVYVAKFDGARPGTYQYRLNTAEKNNINFPSCRVAFPTFTIKVNSKAKAGNSGPVCVGQSIQLSSDEADSYFWEGPNFSSKEKNPVLLNASKEMSGIYVLTVTSNGCTTSDTTTVTILNPPKVITNFQEAEICVGNSIELSASGGKTYLWSPIDGLSDPHTSHPIATPIENTTYSVAVSNGACVEYANISITVIKKPVVNAGKDITIFAGQSTRLQGQISGNYDSFKWVPSEYLDDPKSLNPIATPPTDINYALVASSEHGCLPGLDSVFVRTYPKISIPNSFSPNGDGINDVWEIPSAHKFPQISIKIIDRNGQLIYQSNGPFKPWDGTLNGNNLPVAIYYYRINFNNELQTFSGWINLIR